MTTRASKPSRPTGPALLPVDPDHDLWAVSVGGYVTYAGAEAECRRRLAILTAADPGRDRSDQFLRRAVA